MGGFHGHTLGHLENADMTKTFCKKVWLQNMRQGPTCCQKSWQESSGIPDGKIIYKNGGYILGNIYQREY